MLAILCRAYEHEKERGHDASNDSAPPRRWSRREYWVPAALPALADEAPAYTLPAGTPAYVRAAIEDPARTPEQRARDANRKPAELLMMSGIRPGHTVVEFASFGQYFTTFLSDIVGPKGTVYMYDLPYTDKRAGDASRAFVAAHPNSQYQLVDYNTLELPQKVDEVFIVLYYHDLFINKIDTASLDSAHLQGAQARRYLADCRSQRGARVPARPTHQTASHRSGGDPQGSHRGRLQAGQGEQPARAPGDDHTQIVFAPALRGLTDQTVFVFRKPKG